MNQENWAIVDHVLKACPRYSYQQTIAILSFLNNILKAGFYKL